MNTPEELGRVLVKKTDQQLQEMVARPQDCSPQELNAVCAELEKRNIRPIDAPKKSAPKSGDGMLGAAGAELVCLFILAMGSVFAFIGFALPKRGDLLWQLQQVNTSDPVNIISGICVLLFSLPCFVVFAVSIQSNGKHPRNLFTMPSREVEEFKMKPFWRRFIETYLWILTVGSSSTPAATQCPQCGSADIRRAGPREFNVLIAVGGAFAVVLICLGFFLGWPIWVKVAFGGVIANSLFQAFVQAPKLRFCRKCGGGGFRPPSATSERDAGNRAAMTDSAVRAAWDATWRAWKAGLYSSNAQSEASRVSVKDFTDSYIGKSGRLIAFVMKQRPLEANEFIVGFSSSDDTFVLSNKTLYFFTIDNPYPNPALVIPLCDIEEYHFGTRIVIKLHSGKIIDTPLVMYAPKEEIVNRFRHEARAAKTADTK